MLKVVCQLLLVILLPVQVGAYVFPDKYDSKIKESWVLYHPGNDWLWWKAQLWQESRLNPDAVSPAGAEGIAQFMKGTAIQYGITDRRIAEVSILAGARLMRYNRRFWKANRTEESRRRLSQAGYNCGNGNLMKAQRLCNGANEYEGIVLCLPQVTKHFAAETLGYAPSIEKWYHRMLP